jgi:lipopolysaccharide/colanic/teichoic acid biosynthesis glycosyltransferase
MAETAPTAIWHLEALWRHPGFVAIGITLLLALVGLAATARMRAAIGRNGPAARRAPLAREVKTAPRPVGVLTISAGGCEIAQAPRPVRAGGRSASSGLAALAAPAEILRGGAVHARAKRAADVAFSLAALVVTAPLVGVLALLVKATSRGPAFFCQRRVGWRGKEFTIYKLRTMIADAERDTGPKLADPYDERVTPLGCILRATRLDELPQFWNVLRGEMSVVGPRPERPEFTGEFIATVPGYARRLEVKPGITGLAQVRGGYDSDVREKLNYDWFYVSHQSLWLDLKILLSTVRVVLLRAGR